MTSNYPIYHVTLIGLLGVLLFMWSRKRLSRLESRRKKRVKKLTAFISAETETPIDEPLEDAREKAVDNIENRFSIIRKLTFSLMVVLWLIALVFPFLDNVPATFVSILVAASGIMLGIAARPFIENLISGIVISFSRPVRIGDTVIIDDNYGYVEDITITHTVVKVWNWRRYIIPNSRMLSKEIINCTINDTYQWTHVAFTVAYESDLEKVKEIAVGAASNSTYFANYEDPRFWVMDMKNEGYTCWVAAWTNSPVDAWELRNDIRSALVKNFNEIGIKTHRFVMSCDDHGGKQSFP